jgi:hypothetical protein
MSIRKIAYSEFPQPSPHFQRIPTTAIAGMKANVKFINGIVWTELFIID